MEKQRSHNSPQSDKERCTWIKRQETYRITVAGVIDPNWSDRLGDLCIESKTGDDPNKSISVVEGLVQDQAQLSGILNTLHGLGYKLLSVEILQEESINKG